MFYLDGLCISSSFSVLHSNNSNSSTKSSNSLIMSSYCAGYYSKAPTPKTEMTKHLDWSHRVERCQSQDFRHQALTVYPSEVQTEIRGFITLDVFFSKSDLLEKGSGHLSHLFFLIGPQLLYQRKLFLTHLKYYYGTLFQAIKCPVVLCRKEVYS